METGMNSMAPFSRRHLLIIEDSDEDYFIIEREMKGLKQGFSLSRYKDGDEAIDSLLEMNSKEPSKKRVLPQLILLDLNLPGTDGKEVLKVIKGHERLRTIPVIVFTTSNTQQDVTHCYRLGANSFIQKPMDRYGYRTVFQTIETYWLDLCQLPSFQ